MDSGLSALLCAQNLLSEELVPTLWMSLVISCVIAAAVCVTSSLMLL